MRTRVSVVGSIILFLLVAILIHVGKVVLPDFYTDLAVLLLGSGIALLAWGFKPYLIKNVSLKIKNIRVESSNVGTKHEFKDLIFDIKNNGKIEAIDSRIEVEAKDTWDNTREWVNPNLPVHIERGTFNIAPNDKKTIHFGYVDKKQPTTCLIYVQSSDVQRLKEFTTLTKGIYSLEIRFIGKNFTDNKIHRLKLDLSSWKNIGMKLDC
jgi:hypothetical protein